VRCLQFGLVFELDHGPAVSAVSHQHHSVSSYLTACPSSDSSSSTVNLIYRTGTPCLHNALHARPVDPPTLLEHRSA